MFLFLLIAPLCLGRSARAGGDSALQAAANAQTPGIPADVEAFKARMKRYGESVTLVLPGDQGTDGLIFAIREQYVT